MNLPPASPFIHGQVYNWPTLYSYSPTVLPKPKDWPDWVHVTGYWFLESEPNWQPPVDLVNFLNAGPPPVYVTFGSILIDHNPETLTKLVLDAVARTGQRVILDIGWGGLRTLELPDWAFAVGSDSAPHDWLLPQVKAAVHHGGTGTTFAGLRAGLPTVIIAAFGETFFWGQRIADIGVGLPPIPKKELSVERLAAAIHTAINDKDIQACVADIGKRIRAEDSVARAVEAFHRF